MQEMKLAGREFFIGGPRRDCSLGRTVHETAFLHADQGLFALGVVLTAPNEQAMTNMIEALEKIEAF